MEGNIKAAVDCLIGETTAEMQDAVKLLHEGLSIIHPAFTSTAL